MSDPRRASDDLLLRLIREGRHDAEIAVQLGLSTGQLRERKADLRNRLGTERYQQLTGTAVRNAMSSRKKLFLWGMAVAAGCFAVLLGVANIFAGDPEPEDPHLAVAAQPTPTRAPLVPPKQVGDGGRIFADFGVFLVSGDTDSGPVGTVSNRLALAVIELRGTSYVTSSESVEWTITSSSRTDAFLRGTVSDRQLDVAIYTKRPEAQLRELSRGLGPLLEINAVTWATSPPTIMVKVTWGGSPVEARLRPDGHLLVSLETLGPWNVVEAYTGAALDITAAQPFGTMPGNIATIAQNACDNGPAGAASRGRHGDVPSSLAPLESRLHRAVRRRLLVLRCSQLALRRRWHPSRIHSRRAGRHELRLPAEPRRRRRLDHSRWPMGNRRIDCFRRRSGGCRWPGRVRLRWNSAG